MKRLWSRVSPSVFITLGFAVSVLGIVCYFGASQSVAATTTFTVNSTLDLPDLNPGDGIDRIFDVNNFSGSGITVNFTLQGVTLRNGNAPTTPEGFFEAGGAIQFDGTNFSGANGTLTINNCRITSNTGSGLGGGIFA